MIDSIAGLDGLKQRTHGGSGRDERLMDSAQKLEATFLAEMLKSAGIGTVNDSFGGGIGEEQFASFLRQAYADDMVKSGGIGLAESLFNALKDRADADV